MLILLALDPSQAQRYPSIMLHDREPCVVQYFIYSVWSQTLDEIELLFHWLTIIVALTTK